MKLDGVELKEVGFKEVSAEELNKKLTELNAQFVSKLTPENGVYGIQEFIRENGEIVRQGIDEAGHKIKEFELNGKTFKRYEALGDGVVATTSYDDRGTPYYRRVVRFEKNRATEVSSKLIENTTVEKGNYTAHIDSQGRPASASMRDVKIPTNYEKKAIPVSLKNDSYKAGDQIGHLIAEFFGGPTSPENCVPQTGSVNQGLVKRLENLVRQQVEDGHEVDYEMKVNYVGTETRPSSFEPKIIVDGKEIELPDELKKIYNAKDPTAVEKVMTNVAEKTGLANELGIKSGVAAAGLTFAVTAAVDITECCNGNMDVEEVVMDMAKKTAAASAIAYGTTFISTMAAQALQNSSIELLQAAGESCLPATAVTFAVSTYDIVTDYATKEITTEEFFYKMGETVTSMAMANTGAAVGATAGSLVGPAGTIVGSLVGSMLGCAVTSEVYSTAVELGADGAQYVAEQAGTFAKNAVSAVQEAMPDSVESVRGAFNKFAQQNHIPFSV